MSIILSDLKGRVEDSIYKSIEAVAAATGYSLIKANYQPTAIFTYETDFAAIIANKGFGVEIFGESNPQNKESKKLPRIVVVSQRFLEGDIGGQSQPEFIQQPDKTYNAQINSSMASNLSIDIHLAYGNAQQGRILHAILGAAIGKRNYIPFFDSPNQYFLARQISFNDMSDTSQNLVEKVYTYEIPDLYEAEPQVVKIGVAPVIQITINIEDLGSEVKLDQKVVNDTQ